MWNAAPALKFSLLVVLLHLYRASIYSFFFSYLLMNAFEHLQCQALLWTMRWCKKRKKVQVSCSNTEKHQLVPCRRMHSQTWLLFRLDAEVLSGMARGAQGKACRKMGQHRAWVGRSVTYQRKSESVADRWTDKEQHWGWGGEWVQKSLGGWCQRGCRAPLGHVLKVKLHPSKALDAFRLDFNRSWW